MRVWVLGIALLGALTCAACEEDKGGVPPPPPLTGRANAVTAKEAPSAATASATPATTATARPSAPRKLCADQTPRAAPKGALKTAAASNAEPPPDKLAIGVGKWVWVNLWAAWCGPCKEEIPRILAWQDKLRDAGVLIDLAFVSLDDDTRQTQRFLDAQPANGVRSTYWLPEGDRPAWLGALGLKGTTQLPVQALISPAGQVACVIEGAVEERDYAPLAAFLGAKAAKN
jgi:thiol-disulfide isomerase/thioredoxin